MTSERSWRARWRGLRRWRRDHEWHLVLALGVLSTGLGTVGFWQYYIYRGGPVHSGWDCLYMALQLFPLASGAVEPLAGGSVALPWPLEVARFLSPAVTAFALFKAAAAVFGQQIVDWRARQARGHVIVCGLGPIGLRLVRQWRERGASVVVLEANAAHPDRGAARDLGALVLEGVPSAAEALRRAGILHSRYLFIASQDDAANVQIALQAADLAAGRRGEELSCLVHVVDRRLWLLLREHEYPAAVNARFHVEFFNVYASGAASLLRDYPLCANSDAAPHLLIAGANALAEQLLLRAAQQWCLDRPGRAASLPVTVIDPGVEAWAADLLKRCPLIGQVCTLARAADWRGVSLAEISLAYVCLDDPERALCVALDLQPHLRAPGARLVVQMPEDSGLAALCGARGAAGPEGGAALTPFDLLERTCGPGLFDDGTHENLARAIHAAYVRSEMARGQTPADNQSMVSWDALPEGLKLSNRRQAGAIGAKLRMAGCGLSPWTECGAEHFRFSPAEVEMLAQAEHARWCDDKQRQGWRHGPRRDDAARIHPDLVPWADLSEAAKEKDRNPVRNIPALLAHAGFQIHRIDRY